MNPTLPTMLRALREAPTAERCDEVRRALAEAGFDEVEGFFVDDVPGDVEALLQVLEGAPAPGLSELLSEQTPAWMWPAT